MNKRQFQSGPFYCNQTMIVLYFSELCSSVDVTQFPLEYLPEEPEPVPDTSTKSEDSQAADNDDHENDEDDDKDEL